MIAPAKTYKDYKNQMSIYNIGARIMRITGLEKGAVTAVDAEEGDSTGRDSEKRQFITIIKNIKLFLSTCLTYQTQMCNYWNRNARGIPVMQTKTKYEDQILKDIQDMPVSFQRKVVKIVHFFKKEIGEASINNKTATEKLIKLSGTWKDKKNVEEQIDYIYKHRKSRNRMEKLS
jgi:hypothetical protein